MRNCMCCRCAGQMTRPTPRAAQRAALTLSPSTQAPASPLPTVSSCPVSSLTPLLDSIKVSAHQLWLLLHAAEGYLHG